MPPKVTRHNTPDTEPAGDWRARAECRKSDPELFFPVGKIEMGNAAFKQAQLAKAVCARCVVQDECATYALETSQEFGIWGGLTEDERRELKRRARQRMRLARRATSESGAIL